MTEEVPYDVVKKIGDIEIRRYPEVILAVVEGFIDDSGFSLLFQYISGENKTRRRIAMTAPVITSEKIRMTTPVITKNEYMAFALPSTYTKETVPGPNQPCRENRDTTKKRNGVASLQRTYIRCSSRKICSKTKNIATGSRDTEQGRTSVDAV